MKRLLCFFLLLAGVAGASAKPVAATGIATLTDTVRKKTVHPKIPMSEDELNKILNKIRQKRNDEEKIATLKAEVTDKALTVDQLIVLLNQFLYDDSKLECAEFGFPYTTNYKSFLKIIDLFGQESYKNKLEDFYDAARKH